MFRQLTVIAGFAISAVVAQSILAQTPSTTVEESAIAPPSDKPLQQPDQGESPVDNAEGLAAVGEYPEAINIVELEIEKNRTPFEPLQHRTGPDRWSSSGTRWRVSATAKGHSAPMTAPYTSPG